MYKFVFHLRVLWGMVVQGIRATPENMGSIESSLSDVIWPQVMAAGMAFISWGPPIPMRLSVMMSGTVECMGLLLLLRKNRRRCSWMQELRAARDAQIDRMYPSQHARLAALARRRAASS